MGHPRSRASLLCHILGNWIWSAVIFSLRMTYAKRCLTLQLDLQQSIQGFNTFPWVSATIVYHSYQRIRWQIYITWGTWRGLVPRRTTYFILDNGDVLLISWTIYLFLNIPFFISQDYLMIVNYSTRASMRMLVWLESIIANVSGYNIACPLVFNVSCSKAR